MLEETNQIEEALEEDEKVLGEIERKLEEEDEVEGEDEDEDSMIVAVAAGVGGFFILMTLLLAVCCINKMVRKGDLRRDPFIDVFQESIKITLIRSPFFFFKPVLFLIVV